MNRVLENKFYYLDNFQFVLDWIVQHYADLLVEEEHAFIATFATLSHTARALLVRLVMRKGTLFRTSKLDYAEIGCPHAPLDALLCTGWVDHDPLLTFDELGNLLSKSEIVRVFGLSGALRSAPKAEQLAALRREPAHAHAQPFSCWMQQEQEHDHEHEHEHDQRPAERVLRLHVQALCDRLRLIFFGNLSQDWSEFVLSDLGLLRYERVEFSPQARGLRTRADLEHYLRLQACKDGYYAGQAAADILIAFNDAVPVEGFDNPWLVQRQQRLMFRLGQLFEKEQHWDQAYAVYDRCRYPGARSRAIRVLEKRGKFEQAHALLESAQASPQSEAEQQQLLRIGMRLARKLGHPRRTAPPAPLCERLDLVLPARLDMRVEHVVLAHLCQHDAPVFYVENALANALLGLLCWPAIFAAVPGAFFHPFHRAPADLHSADFHARRRALFDACLALLDDGSHCAAILRTYDEKIGLQSPFVAWEWLSRDLIELALDCIPAAHIRQWCLRILQDVRENRSGFPDLIQFFPRQARYRMIEVKGPGDRLQDNQLRWIDYCARHDMPVAVCYLQWQGVAS